MGRLGVPDIRMLLPALCPYGSGCGEVNPCVACEAQLRAGVSEWPMPRAPLTSSFLGAKVSFFV